MHARITAEQSELAKLFKCPHVPPSKIAVPMTTYYHAIRLQYSGLASFQQISHTGNELFRSELIEDAVDGSGGGGGEEGEGNRRPAARTLAVACARMVRSVRTDGGGGAPTETGGGRKAGFLKARARAGPTLAGRRNEWHSKRASFSQRSGVDERPSTYDATISSEG